MNYESKLNIRDTQAAIRFLKHRFEDLVCDALNLTRASAPLFVPTDSGLNDNLSGVERPVAFDVPGADGRCLEVVQSLAKWKRMALAQYGIPAGAGIYTDMNAIRRDETADELHSFYVDQWDWEKVISAEDRTVDYLKETVRGIYDAMRMTEVAVCNRFPALKPQLPRKIVFITSQELFDRYPGMTAKERENAFAREVGAYFLMQIGGPLSDGKPHDGRAPDYDDWSLNGDIILYYPLLDRAMEISSMGIRVDRESLLSQLSQAGALSRLELPFHKALLAGELPLTVGGGIGQSRLCMFMLQKAHIGEVQASVWPESELKRCREEGICLL